MSIICLLNAPLLYNIFLDIAKASTIRFLSKNLNTLELLQLCNKYVTPLAPEDTIALASSNKAEQQKSKKQQTKRK